MRLGKVKISICADNKFTPGKYTRGESYKCI